MNYRQLIAALTPLHGAGEARAIVRMVMEERFGLSQTDLLLGKGTDFSADDRAEWEKIASRLLAGEPVQYVLGHANFCGHRFRVTPDVLIPRPETEELTQLAIEEARASMDAYSREHPPLSFLDLCTGSGCIAITLALAFPSAHVVGVDISAAALDVARANAMTLGAGNVTFLQADVLDGQKVGNGRYNLIISNPPYVRDSEAAEMTRTVLDHEPHLALFVPDNDPLRFYRAIAAIAHNSLQPEGTIFMEVNSTLAEEALQLARLSHLGDAQLLHDSFGRLRIVKATLKPSSRP